MTRFSRPFAALALCLSAFQVVLASSRTSPPPGAFVVRSGSINAGEYNTITAAVNALPNDTSSQVIFIYPGTYSEQVDITRPGPLIVYGYTTDALSYVNNEVTITANATLLSAGSDDASGTLRVHTDNVALYNINIKNTYGPGVQAIAYSNYGNNTGAYGVGLYGYQDTLLAEEGSQVYLKSYIEGAVDFIFGQRGQVYFEGNTIATRGAGCITASGRSTNDSTSYVFNYNAVITASDAFPNVTDSVFFGRPWSNYSKVIFKNTEVTAPLNSSLWSIWNVGDPRTNHVFYADYNTTGSGAYNLTRPAFATELTADEAAEYNISSALGDDWARWVDMSYLL